MGARLGVGRGAGQWQRQVGLAGGAEGERWGFVCSIPRAHTMGWVERTHNMHLVQDRDPEVWITASKAWGILKNN